MKAMDVMQCELITTTAEASIDDAVRLMVAHHISGLPVVDASGALSEGDLLRRTELGTEAKVPAWIGWLVGQVELLGVITDERTRQAMQVLTENTPGVRAVTNNLIWIEPMSGIPIGPQPWHEADRQEARS